MTWHFTTDPAVFRAAAGAHLAAEPARDTAVLTLMETAARLGWWTEPGGRVTGVAALARGGALSLGATTEEAARALVLPDGDEPVELRGETAAVEAYAHGTGRPWEPAARMRLFRLGALTPPDPAPAGRARLATEADLPLLGDWTAAFARAIGEEPAADHTDFLTGRITEGRLHLWEAPDGRPVSMAAVSRTLAGQARVHLVYTPDAERGRGYAAGATTAVSRAALDSGAAAVVLFTDLANPTSNALYRRLGYRPVTDHLAVRLTPRS
ncbi:GNAT family N-acetyltransferase [Streptomyces sp. CC208A]|uniref:GNAT family N-acetyltransferase n=1 Tax=Streptomyces sp. CC208A TaxID=3044573 RepID=UPI0024A84D26|nr:GNAT family N-acetyltransferase [Streptomyces sp. CC208A]